ncbi:MAG TPA: AAA family ATPase [Euryarchaeota archaeon]|nr:AAA family ATPase [Euryarchaeota archaeon]
MCGRFDRYSKGSIVTDLAKLSFDYVPEKLVHRDEEIDTLFELMRRVVDSNLAQNVLMKGPVGTGKTAVSNLFCKEFSHYARNNDVNLRVAFVNCRQRNTEASTLLKILSIYDPHFPDRGFSTTEMMDILRKQLKKENSRLIVVLDEVDVLIKKKGSDLIYAFTRFAEDTSDPAPISLLLISQKNILDMLDPSSLSTFKRSNVVNFGKYSKNQLKDILSHRVEIAFRTDTVEDEAIDLIADIASQWGDARYAIEILEKAAMSANRGQKKILCAEDVRLARADTYSTFSPEDLTQLERPVQVAFLGILRSLGSRAYTTTGEAEKEYRAVCEEYGDTPRGHTQFWSYIQTLDALGFITAERSGQGIQGKTTVIGLPDVPIKKVMSSLERNLR